MDIWRPQLPALVRHHRVLRYDLPGHGGCATSLLADPAGERTTVAELARLVLGLADRHGPGAFHYAGVSLGGAIGAHLAVHHPDRVSSLALICSSGHFGEAGPWRERAALVRREGTGGLVTTAPGRWFADQETAATPRGAALLADLAEADPAGYAACCDALAGYDLRPELGRITAPTLVVAGARDVAAPPAHARELVAGIPGASLEVVDAGHLAGVERPEEVTAHLLEHLAASG
jgi:3-oxoadipate enol-lactonase